MLTLMPTPPKSFLEVMLTIIAESYPSTHFLKDYKSDYQVRTDLSWEDFMKGDKVPNIEQLRQILVNNIEPNEVETDPHFLRRGIRFHC